MNCELLRTKIDEQGFKHSALARRLGMHPSQFSRALAGKATFDVDQFAKLIKIINVKFEALTKAS